MTQTKEEYMEAQRVRQRGQEAKHVRTHKRFEAKLKLLPKEAHPEDEIEWIRNHHAMTRWQRLDGKVVRLLPKDLEGAPSQAAVIALQHWANHPADFHKHALTKQVKQILDKDEGDDDAEILDNIEALLASLDGAVAPNEELQASSGAVDEVFQ